MPGEKEVLMVPVVLFYDDILGDIGKTLAGDFLRCNMECKIK